MEYKPSSQAAQRAKVSTYRGIFRVPDINLIETEDVGNDPGHFFLSRILTNSTEHDPLQKPKSVAKRKIGSFSQQMKKLASLITFVLPLAAIPSVEAIPFHEGQKDLPSGPSGGISVPDYMAIAIGLLILTYLKLIPLIFPFNRANMSGWFAGLTAFVWWASKCDDHSSTIFLAT